jgi:hypothetical protein
MLDQNEITLRRQKWYSGAIWIYVVALTTTFLVLGGMRADTPVGLFLGIFACLLLIAAAVELLKYFINRSRVELLKEMKGLEVQLLEIKEQLRAQAPSSFGSPLAPREVPK